MLLTQLKSQLLHPKPPQVTNAKFVGTGESVHVEADGLPNYEFFVRWGRPNDPGNLESGKSDETGHFRTLNPLATIQIGDVAKVTQAKLLSDEGENESDPVTIIYEG